MTRALAHFIAFAAFFFTFAIAVPAQAAKSPTLLGGYWGPLLNCGGDDLCTDFCDLLTTAQAFIYFGLTLVIFVFAPIMIAVGGVFILTAGGSEERFKKGKSAIYGAVTGVVVAFLAFVIVNTFLDFLDAGGDADIGWRTITCNVQE